MGEPSVDSSFPRFSVEEEHYADDATGESCMTSNFVSQRPRFGQLRRPSARARSQQAGQDTKKSTQENVTEPQFGTEHDYENPSESERQLQRKYDKEMESRQKLEELAHELEQENVAMKRKVEDLTAENRSLKNRLLDFDQYTEEYGTIQRELAEALLQVSRRQTEQKDVEMKADRLAADLKAIAYEYQLLQDRSKSEKEQLVGKLHSAHEDRASLAEELKETRELLDLQQTELDETLRVLDAQIQTCRDLEAKLTIKEQELEEQGLALLELSNSANSQNAPMSLAEEMIVTSNPLSRKGTGSGRTTPSGRKTPPTPSSRSRSPLLERQINIVLSPTIKKRADAALQRQIELLTEQVETYSSDVEKSRAETRMAKEAINTLQRDLTETHERMERTQALLQEKAEMCERLQSELKTEPSKQQQAGLSAGEYQKAKTTVERLTREIAEKEKEVERLKKQAKEQTQRHDEYVKGFEREVANAKEKAEKLGAEVDGLKKESAEKEEARRVLAEQMGLLEDSVWTLEAERENLARKITAVMAAAGNANVEESSIMVDNSIVTPENTPTQAQAKPDTSETMSETPCTTPHKAATTTAVSNVVAENITPTTPAQQSTPRNTSIRMLTPGNHHTKCAECAIRLKQIETLQSKCSDREDLQWQKEQIAAKLNERERKTKQSVRVILEHRTNVHGEIDKLWEGGDVGPGVALRMAKVLDRVFADVAAMVKEAAADAASAEACPLKLYDRVVPMVERRLQPDPKGPALLLGFIMAAAITTSILRHIRQMDAFVPV